jgi:hypothetical protein
LSNNTLDNVPLDENPNEAQFDDLISIIKSGQAFCDSSKRLRKQVSKMTCESIIGKGDVMESSTSTLNSSGVVNYMPE